MTHSDNAELLRQFVTGETTEFNHGNILPFGRALDPHIDDYESVVDTKGFKYCGDNYRNAEMTEVNSHLMRGLVLFAYARESVLAKTE